MKVLKEEEVKKDEVMKVKASDILILDGVYGRMLMVDFDDYMVALKLSEDVERFTDKLRPINKLRETVLNKFKEKAKKLTDEYEDRNDPKLKSKMEALDAEYRVEENKIFQTEHEIELKHKIPSSVLKDIKIKILEVRLLQKLNLLEEEVTK